LDQGPTLGNATGLCPRTRLRCDELGSVRVYILTHRPRCSILRELIEIINLESTCQPRSTDYRRIQPTNHNSTKSPKHLDDSNIEPRSSKLLIPFGLRLGRSCSGLGLADRLYELLHRCQTLGLRSGLPSSLHSFLPSGLRREAFVSRTHPD
jgi:hypothetical protein